jgi:hypothetical protein
MKKIMFYLLTSSFVVSSLGFLALIPFELGGSKIYAFDLLCGFYVLVGLLLILNSKVNFYFPKYFMLMALFLGIAIISLTLKSGELTSSQLINSLFYTVRLCIYYFFSLITYNLFNKDSEFKEKIISA